MRPTCPIIQNSKLIHSTDSTIKFCQFPFLKETCKELQISCVFQGNCIIQKLSQDIKEILVHHIADNILSQEDQKQLMNELLILYKPLTPAAPLSPRPSHP